MNDKLRGVLRAVFAFLALIAAYSAASYLLSQYLGDMSLPAVYVFTLDSLLKAVFGVLALITLRFAFGVVSPKSSTKRLLSALFVTGALAWGYIALNALASSGEIDRTYPPIDTAVIIALYAVNCLAIGFVEEAICRALLLGGVFSCLRNEENGALRALLISSAAFALWHLVNLVYSPQLIYSTISQVIYAFIFGMFFGALYLRWRSLAAVAILHGIFDFACYVWLPFSSEAGTALNTDIPPMAIISTAIMYLPLLISATYIMRKQIQPSILELWNDR